ncbi:MAG: ribonuclease D [Magnetococcales bacterium]|nr:ribonuclease D [Magnetococcales bacterium]
MTVQTAKPLVLLDDLDEERFQCYMDSKYLAVDTETLGLQVKRDRLCLVQMCNEDGVTTLVQTKSYNAPRLKKVLESPKVEKIFHFARFDLATLRHWLGCQVAPTFCTKIASRLVRTYTDGHGLKDITRELLDIELDKQQQSSDWAADVLSQQQIEYAASDVIHLVEMKQKLAAMLQRDGRTQLANVCMDFLPHRVSLDLAGWDEEDIFSHSSKRK